MEDAAISGRLRIESESDTQDEASHTGIINTNTISIQEALTKATSIYTEVAEQEHLVIPSTAEQVGRDGNQNCNENVCESILHHFTRLDIHNKVVDPQ